MNVWNMLKRKRKDLRKNRLKSKANDGDKMLPLPRNLFHFFLRTGMIKEVKDGKNQA